MPPFPKTATSSSFSQKLLRIILATLGSLTCFSHSFETSSVTDIRIEGLTGLSEKDVLSRLGGRLDFITSRPPSRSRADDADFLVSRVLEKEGYSDVNISWKIPADRKSIILRVTSGPRLIIDDVNIEGTSQEDAEVMKQYFKGKTLLGGKAEIPYLVDKTDEAANSAITYLKSQGYWSAKGKLAPPAIDLTKREVDLTIKTQPGPIHKITSLEVSGTLPPELSELPNRLQRYLNRTASSQTLIEIRDGTNVEIRDLGYQFSRSSLEAKHKNGESRLTLTLEPGQRFHLRKAQLSAENKTDLSRAQKLINRATGQPYEEEKIKKLRSSLLATGAFDTVEENREIDNNAKAIDVTLHATEGKDRGITSYAGAGTFEGVIVGASYYDRNLFDALYNFNIAAEFSLVGLLGEISVTDPFFLGYDLQARPRAFALTRTFDEYNKFEAGFGFSLTYKPTPRQIWKADALLSFATVQPEDLPASALGETNYLLTTAGLSWTFDGRDSPVNPTKGIFARLRAEVGNAASDSQNPFLRLDAQIAYHVPLDEKNSLGFNLRTGIIAPANTQDLPVDLRFFIGGRDSVRSFPFRELGPNINGVATGGQSFWYANIEYVRKLVGPVSGVVFLDAGSLDESAAAWPSFDPKLALGLGVRIELPIGPIRFEYGHALNPAPEDPFGAFHFSIGVAF